MEFLAHLPVAAYGIVAAIVVVFIARFVTDTKMTAAAHTSHRLALEKTKRHHRPTLTILITAQSSEGALATFESFRTYYSHTNAIFLVDSTATPKLASGLRYRLKKHSAISGQVVARKQPDVLPVLREQAKGTLVLAVPEGSHPSRTFYQLALMPFIDSLCRAVVLPHAVRPNTTLTSGGEALFWAWRHFIRQVLRQPTPSDPAMLATGIIMRRSSLGKPLNKTQWRTASQAAYTTQPAHNFSGTLQSITGAMRHPVAVTAGLVITMSLLIGGIISAHDLFVTLCFGAIIGITSWWALGSVHAYSFTTKVTLLLLMPFFAMALPVALVVRGVRMLFRTSQPLSLPVTRRHTP